MFLLSIMSVCLWMEDQLIPPIGVMSWLQYSLQLQVFVFDLIIHSYEHRKRYYL
jgi:hypothetical protein